MTTNNPLQQYFRRPAVYFKLPSNGVGYPAGTIDPTESGEFPVYPMTALDEITNKTPDALFNGTAIANLVTSCVPNIKDPWKILSSDLDAILLAIKAASYGNELEIGSTCPKCNESAEYTIDIVRVLQTLNPGDYTTPMLIGDLKIKFKPLTFTEMNAANVRQFEVQKLFASLMNLSEDERTVKTNEIIKNVTELTMTLIAKSIEFIETPNSRVVELEFIVDYLHNCDKNTYINIRDYQTSLKEKSEIKPQSIKCVHCGHEYLQPFGVNVTDFFD